MTNPLKSKAPVSSIRTRITLLAIIIAVVAMTVATVIGTISIKKLGDESAEQMLTLLCQTGEKNLDHYFESVAQSVTVVSDMVMRDLEQTDLTDEGLIAHTERVRELFGKAAYQTYGVLTYYYRFDPALSENAKGFWYINLDDNGFTEHEVTPLSVENTSDTSSLVWFTVPKFAGKSIWLPPYITDNLDTRVISYNTPVYKGDTFVGVVGIEIDYSTMASEVDSIKLYQNGYAFINDADGNIIYHPHIDVTAMTEEERPVTPDGIVGAENHVYYVFEGVEKQAVRLPLRNGMILNVSVPVSEINNSWQRMVNVLIIVAAVLLAGVVLLTLRFAGKITRPLRELTEAAEQVGEGNYDAVLNYSGNDEVGILARTFDRLIGHLKIYISDLNSLAHTDALTAVRNKVSYDLMMRELQDQINDPGETPAFAIAMFDCDDLKLINDRYGHDKGDIYLKNTAGMICRVFRNSPVFRIGGDEFAVIMQEEDFDKREELKKAIEDHCLATCTDENEWWDQVRVSVGVASYEPGKDRTAGEVARRADKLMYENKHTRKAGR